MKPWTAFAAAGLVGGGVCAADLPTNYTRLNWVESTGQQAVITDYVPMNTDSVETKLMFTSISSGTAVFDAREPEAKHRYTLLLLADGKFRMDWNALNETVQKFTLEAGVPYDICVAPDKRRLTVDQDPAQLSIKLSEEKVQKGLRLFAAQTVNAADGSLSMYASIRLFSFTVKDKAGNVQLDLVPCTTDEGEVGLWDTVAGKFHGSSTGQGLLPGPRTVSVTLTAYSAATGVASLAFAGVDREMNLIARTGDEAKVAATVPSGTTALDVAVPCFETAMPSEVRFVLSDFVPVTGIKGFGTHAINTGVVPDATTTTRFRAAPENVEGYADRCQFGIAGAYFAFIGWNNLLYAFLGDVVDCGWSQDYRNGSMHTIAFGPAGFFVDETRRVGPFTAGDVTTDRPILLCGRYQTSGASSASDWKLDCCTFAWAEIEKGGKLVRCFQPCLKDGVGQFYETCEGKFYKNDTSLGCTQLAGFFSAGPIDVEAVDFWACGVSEMISSVLPSSEPRTVAVTSYEAATGAAELAFSAGKEKKLLYVAKGDCDRGPDAAKWGAFAFLGEVGPSVTSGGYTVPAALRGQGALRFFLTRYLPPDQRPVEVCEYVESRGEAYVEVTTGYVPKNTDKVRMKVSVSVAGGNHALLEARTLDASKRVGLWASPDTPAGSRFRFRVDRGSSCCWSATPDVVQAEKAYDLYSDFAAYTLSVDGSQVLDYSGRPDMTAAETSIPMTLWIFASRTVNEGKPQYIAQAKLRSLAITNRAGTCELELVPCVKDGVGALYDRVTGAYLKSATATPLVASGPGLAAELKDAESASEPVRGACDVSFRVKVSDWTVTATVGEGTTGGRIFVATAKEDCGESVDDWPYVAEIGAVTAGDRTLTAALPEEWKALKTKCYRVFLACAEPRCPYDCLLSTLSGDGDGGTGPYVDTGVVPDATTTIELMETKAKSYNSEFGVKDRFCLFDNINTIWYAFFDAASSRDGIHYAGDGKPHKIVLGPDGGYVDDATVVAGPLAAKLATDLTMTLFGRRTSATTVDCAPVSIDYAKVWQGGRLVRDFVPCAKDGVGCLYDRVGGELYGNEGTGAFALGEPRGGAVMESEVVGVSEVTYVIPGLSILVK